MHHCKVKSHGIWESNSSQKLNGITTTLVDLRILFNNFPEIRKITGHRKAKTSTFRHMRTSILVDENEDNFSFLMYICTCMSEVSGIFGMCMAFCVHPMCSNYETLLTDYSWKTSQVASSMQVKYKSATWVNAWGASQVQVLDLQVEYSNALWLGPSSAKKDKKGKLYLAHPIYSVIRVLVIQSAAVYLL